MKQWIEKRRNTKILFRFFALILVFVMAFALTACNKQGTVKGKLKDLEFTVVEDLDVPEEVKTLIEEKKSEPFQFSYGTRSYLYAVVGYGEKETGGFSISVDEFYETEDTIHMKTTLLGPGSEEKKTKAKTYPYVVIKTEFLDKKVEFE